MIYVIFILSLIAVTKGADWLVEGAINLANLWGVSQIVIGATIVSLGTTLPEALIGAFAASQGKGDVVAGTALGSILFNTAVILGLAAAIKPPHLANREHFYKAGTMVGVLVLFGLLSLDHQVSRANGLLLGIILILFLGSNIWGGVHNSKKKEDTDSQNRLYAYLLRILAGSAGVVVGAHYLLNSGVEIAKVLGVPEAIIAVTLFAVGSSLPELITVINAALKGHTDLIFGNVIGANTLNIIFVITTASLIKPFTVSPSVISNNIPFALLMMAILLVPAIFNKRISRLQGISTILAYIAYLFVIIGRS